MGTKVVTTHVTFCDDCKKELGTYEIVKVTMTEEQISGHNGDPYDSDKKIGEFCQDCWLKMRKGK